MLHDDPTERVHKVALSRLGLTLAGRFTLNRIIAIGGMATVYEATQAPLMRKVAVKVLHPTEIEAGRTDFFLREANAASALRHPNIISIVDFGQEDDGTLFLAMEFVPGLDLGDLLSQHFPLPTERLVHIADQICLALEVAHRAGVVHCDMKPSNVMVESVPGNPDFVKVVDFGISRVAVDDPEQEEDEEVLGSFFYMAPEQALGTNVSPRTDIYGLGAVLYAALAGAVPFHHVPEVDLLHHIVHVAPPRPSTLRPELDIPPELEAIVLRAMAKDPTERFASAADMRSALRKLTAAEHPHKPDSLEIFLEDDEIFTLNFDLPEDLELELNLPDNWEAELDLPEDLDDLQGSAAPPPAPRPTAADTQDAPVPRPLRPPAADLARVDTDSLGPPHTNPLKPTHTRATAPTLIGRDQQLALLREAVQRTRRGATAVRILGETGAGRSFFLEHALQLLQNEGHAVVLNAELLPGDRERPYTTLASWVHAALANLKTSQHTPHSATSHDELDIFTSAPIDPLNPGVRPSSNARILASSPSQDLSNSLREELASLRLAPLELETLASLMQRWRLPSRNDEHEVWLDEGRAFDNTPLRLPETRRHLLRYALEALLRCLMQHAQKLQPRSPHLPIILSVDGWEHCDVATRRIIRRLLTEGRNLPLLFIATTDPPNPHNPDYLPEHPDLDDPSTQPDWDLDIPIAAFTRTDVDLILQIRLPSLYQPALAQRLHALSGGSPLVLRELLLLLTAHPGDVLHPELPDNLATLLGQQIDDLSQKGKMLLAVCAILGHSFPTALLRATLPSDFDTDGTLAELIGSRILEPIPSSVDRRLRFRLPLLREIATRRMNPARAQQLHLRIASMLQARPMAIPRTEAEVHLAIHFTRGGDAHTGLDHLLDAAEAALERWEPELAIRRFRQISLWIERNDPQPWHGALRGRAIRATLGLLKSARRLGFKPQKTADAVIPEKLPQRFLDAISAEESNTAPERLLAEAALETGRYLTASDLLQNARAALQTALTLARRVDDAALALEIEFHLASALLRLGKLGLAADVAVECHARFKALGPPPPLSDAALSLRSSQPLALLGEICIERGKYTLADEYLTQARRLAEADADLDRLHEIHTHRARLAHLQNRPAETVQALETAREFAFRAHDLRAQARILYNLGVTLALAGNTRRAEQQLRVASVIARALAWREFIALVDDHIKRLA